MTNEELVERMQRCADGGFIEVGGARVLRVSAVSGLYAGTHDEDEEGELVLLLETE